MIITSDLFEAFVKCSTKCFLKSKNQTDKSNLYSQWIKAERDRYGNEARAHLLETLPSGKCVNFPTNVGDLQARDWRLAFGFDARTEKLTSSIHAVEHLPSAGAASIVPIRFVCTNRITRDDKLLLAFDSLVLSDILGRPVKSGKIIHGDQYATVKINTLVVRRKVQELVAQTASLLSTPSPPEIVLNRHCPACEFRIQCRQKAVEKDDLSLMSRMTAKERKAFHNRGIFTLTHLSYTFRPHRRATPKSKTALLSEAIFIGRLNLDEAILKSNEMTLNKGIDERFSSTN